MSEQTLAQRRAKHALNSVNELIAQGNYGNYKSYVSGLPANILMSGLGQAVATLKAAGKPAHLNLYEHVSSWLCGGDDDSPYPQGDLLKHITGHSEDRYLHAQGEAMAYLEWLKKFAVAFLKDAKEQD